MATQSAIEWTEATWNPVTGCDEVSPGCAHRYAERMAKRLQEMGTPNHANGFALTLQRQMLDAPLTWRRPRKIFVQCGRARVAFFFKQWGGVFKSRTGRQLDGRTWDEMPPTTGARPSRQMIRVEPVHP